MKVSSELRVATKMVVGAMTPAELIACVDNDDFVMDRIVALMAERSAAADRKKAITAMYRKVGIGR